VNQKNSMHPSLIPHMSTTGHVAPKVHSRSPTQTTTSKAKSWMALLSLNLVTHQVLLKLMKSTDSRNPGIGKGGSKIMKLSKVSDPTWIHPGTSVNLCVQYYLSRRERSKSLAGTVWHERHHIPHQVRV